MRKAFSCSILALLLTSALGVAQQTEKGGPPVNPVLCPYNADGAPDFVYHGDDALFPGDGGDPGLCPNCSGCGCPRDFLWAEAEYLAWWIKNGPVAAPLVTIGNATDAVPGALLQPSTGVLLGDSIDYKTFS